MRLLLFILFFIPSLCEGQLLTLKVRNDTLFSFNPLTSEERQLTKLVPPPTGQAGKILGANSTTYTWMDAPLTGTAALPTTGTVTASMTSSVLTVTPTGAMTINATGGVVGQLVTFSITTSGTTSYVITFGTGFRKTGTLTTGTVTARFFTVTFRCVAIGIWSEVSRTIAQT